MKPIAASTQKSYDCTLDSFFRRLKTFGQKDNPQKFALENPEESIELVNQFYASDYTKKNVLIVLNRWALREGHDCAKLYKDAIASVHSLIRAERDKQVPDPTIDYTKDLASMTDTCLLRDKVITMFYDGRYLPVWRVKELHTLKYKDYNPEIDNYIDGNKIVLNSYKTSKVYGRQEVEIPTEMRNIMDQWLDCIKTKPCPYFIQCRNNTPMSQNALSTTIRKLLGHSANKCRSIYLTKLYQNGKLSTEEKKQKVCKSMRTGVSNLPSYVKSGDLH